MRTRIYQEYFLSDFIHPPPPQLHKMKLSTFICISCFFMFCSRSKNRSRQERSTDFPNQQTSNVHGEMPVVSKRDANLQNTASQRGNWRKLQRSMQRLQLNTWRHQRPVPSSSNLLSRGPCWQSVVRDWGLHRGWAQRVLHNCCYDREWVKFIWRSVIQSTDRWL